MALKVKEWVLRVMAVLLPHSADEELNTPEKVERYLQDQKKWLINTLKEVQKGLDDSPEQVGTNFFDTLPKIHRLLKEDINAFLKHDQKARSELEVIKSHSGFLAVSFYRVAHELHKLKAPLIAQIISEAAHTSYGANIHPGAEIGNSFYLSQGNGVVIG